MSLKYKYISTISTVKYLFTSKLDDKWFKFKYYLDIIQLLLIHDYDIDKYFKNINKFEFFLSLIIFSR